MGVLVAESGGVVELGQLHQLPGPVADLLLELAAGGLLRRLTVHVPLARGHLEEVVADRGAVLAHQQHVVAVDRDHDDRTRMVHDDAGELLGVRRSDPLLADAEEAHLRDDFGPRGRRNSGTAQPVLRASR